VIEAGHPACQTICVLVRGAKEAGFIVFRWPAKTDNGRSCQWSDFIREIKNDTAYEITFYSLFFKICSIDTVHKSIYLSQIKPKSSSTILKTDVIGINSGEK